jgi:hypothetical protein
MTRVLIFLPIVLLGCFVVSSIALSQAIAVSSSYEPDFHFKVNGKDFFPIGWYNSTKPADLQTVKKSGATVVIGYWNFIWEQYGNGRPKPYTQEEYLISLRAYLREVDRAGLKAIVDLGANEDGKSGFSLAGMVEIVDTFANDPAVFAWYLYDEPFHKLYYFNCGAAPTREYLQVLADSIRAAERRKLGVQKHPVIPVVTDPRFFADYQRGGKEICKDGRRIPLPPPFYPSSYDAIGWDAYVYTKAMDAKKQWWNDYNNVSRLVARRGVEQTRKLRKMGFIFVGQGADKSAGTDLRQLTAKEILYQSVSPIIQGARGLLFWWWVEQESSPATRTAINKFIQFFRTNNLDNVVMRGENLDAQVRFQSVTVKGAASSREKYRWKLNNNLNREIEDPSDPETLNFRLFNSIARKYAGAYYIFAVNDYRHLVRSTLVLDGLVRSDESIRRVLELRVDGKGGEQTLTRGTKKNSARFPVSLAGYDVKIYKVELGP